MVTLYRQMHCFDREWLRAVAQAANDLVVSQPHQTSKVIFAAIERNLEKQLNNDDSSEEVVQKLRLLSSQYKKRGVQLAENSEELDQWNQVQVALREYESKFVPIGGVERESSVSKRERLEDMYAIIALKTHAAKLLGFPNEVESQLRGRAMMASTEDIQKLHEEVASHAIPAVEKSSGSPWNTSEQNEMDLSEYLTLDGTLAGLFALTRALFGIVIKEEVESPVNAWYPDVRLFHVLDDTTEVRLGSFYLDAYQRPIKAREAYMGQLHSNLVYLNCSIPPSTWNDMPTQLKLSDALDLFHEFGHVLQFLLAKDQKGLLGSRNTPEDISEVVPQVSSGLLFLLQTTIPCLFF
jgi:Zn-dependent oligopeptidase